MLALVGLWYAFRRRRPVIVNGNWKFDMARTQERYRTLKEYYDTRGLNADNFSCPKYPDCLGSQKEGTIQQYLGGTAGLTPFYDVEYKNTPIRVLIVGKETGYMANTQYGTSPNFDANTLNVLNCINWKRKNNSFMCITSHHPAILGNWLFAGFRTRRPFKIRGDSETLC